jgi:hypothetical protein
MITSAEKHRLIRQHCSESTTQCLEALEAPSVVVLKCTAALSLVALIAFIGAHTESRSSAEQSAATRVQLRASAEMVGLPEIVEEWPTPVAGVQAEPVRMGAR